ncbi:5-bromo-4-chloroindolyl phosphate hydrolysis family protein [Peptoniphilus raoultii]|uniref:5-bromo-4-chloroindolyl phosphate hydrolysis family protein n=1 Tax=Peptoniphilus raoultii TaxID=1776387 RepID=UPI0008DA73CB|nr:5-bromo-4-chloroindolyl phosphate hydrolysis family protein [Peptoniphilus raoultii]
MEKNGKKSEEDFNKIVDHAIKDENFKDLNKFINESIDAALNFTKSSIDKLVSKRDNGIYSVNKDDNIINQKPKMEKRIKTWSGLSKFSLVGHSFLFVVFLINLFTRFESDIFLMIIFWLLPGIGLSFYGLKKTDSIKKQIVRFRKYKREIGNNTVIPVMDLAVAVAKSKEFTIKDLLDLIDKDFFRQARIVENGELFILDSKTYKLYKKEKLNEISKEDLKQIEEENISAGELIDRAKADITQIANSVDNLKEPMKSKITNLLGTVRKIFKMAREDSDTAKDLTRFVDYYLPTTTKLVDSYKNLQDSPTRTMKASLTEIEKAVDTINNALLKLLDKIFEDKAIDISSDISVLKTMLRQEGLLNDEVNLGGKNG